MTMGGGFWAMPRFWPGKTVIIVASGPSLSALQVGQIYNMACPVIAVNNAFEAVPYADMLYAADWAWWAAHWKNAAGRGPGAKDFAGLKVTTEAPYHASVLRVNNTGEGGFDPRPHCVRTGGNSAYQAACLAIHGGAKRLILMGCDCRKVEGGPSHFFGHHTGDLRRASDYDRWVQNWRTLAPAARALGVEIINATTRSAIDAFHRMDMAQCLAHYKDFQKRD